MPPVPRWASRDTAEWQRALDLYPDVIRRQGIAQLTALDDWYRDELQAVVARSHSVMPGPRRVERTLWSSVGGKACAAAAG